MLFRRIATLAVASGAVLLGTVGIANAGDVDVGQPTAQLAQGEDCRTATYTLANPTPWPQTFDYRTSNEAPVNPVEPELAGLSIEEGPLAGQQFGPTWHQVTVPAGGTITDSLTFEEDFDGGTTTLQVRLVRGPEQHLFFGWQSLDVVTDCKGEPEPEVTPSASFGDVQDCECEPPGFKANLVNPTDAELVFSIDTIVGETTDTVDVTVPAGETIVSHAPGVEDTEALLRIRVGEKVLAETAATLDCEAPPTEPTDPPTDPQDPPADKGDTPPADDPPAEPKDQGDTPPTVQPNQPQPVNPVGGGSHDNAPKTVTPAANEELAYTGSTFNAPLWLAIGGGVIALGAIALVLARRRHSHR